jgi:hypothetical protein
MQRETETSPPLRAGRKEWIGLDEGSSPARCRGRPRYELTAGGGKELCIALTGRWRARSTRIAARSLDTMDA